MDQKRVIERLSLPLFIKPARLGSSIGISKVTSASNLSTALQKAFKYDERILVEEGIVGREFELSVLGNLSPKASLPGELIPTHEFYSCDAKYHDAHGAEFVIPAKLPLKMVRRMQDLAIQVFRLMRCEGMARVDLFLTKSGVLLVNEINTIPGFTPISLYPKPMGSEWFALHCLARPSPWACS